MDHAVVGAAERTRPVMAFETNSKDGGARQHLWIRRAVRHVAGLASIDANGGVLVDKRPALVGMAFEARLFVAFLLIDQVGSRAHTPGRGKRAVRIVAIRTLDGTLIHPMLERHRELRLHRSVAGITKLTLLLLREQKSRSLRVVDRVAVGADDIRLRVRAPADIGARERLRMATEAGVESLFGPDFGKRDNGRLTAVCFDVGFPRSVAALAAGIFGRLFTAGDALVVRITKELVPNRSVAGLAGFAANVIRGRSNNRQKKGSGNHPKQLHTFNLASAAA